MRSIIKYIGIALVIVGILLVMKNLFAKDTDWTSDNKGSVGTKYYNASIKLLDKETGDYLVGAKLVLKDDDGKVITEWVTEDRVYIVNKLKKGTYTLTEVSAPDNYHLDEKGITFEITTKDKNVIMYNTAMTEEEIKEANTISTNVKVDNTVSSKNMFIGLLSMVSIVIGLNIIYKVKKSF